MVFCGKATVAKEESLIKSYEEQLNLIYQGVKIENIEKNTSSEQLLEQCKTKIEEDTNFEGSTVEIIDNRIEVITKEGYIFHIIEGKVEYVGKDGEEKGPITANMQTTEITNKKVSFIANVEGASGRKLTYILYVNGEEKQRVTTYKTTFYSNEQSTKFGEVLKAYVEVKYEEEKSYTTNEMSIEDNTIGSKEELEIFRNKVNNEKITYEGKTIQLVEDIDLEGSSTNQWIPIAQETAGFKGTLEGNNHKIKKLYMDVGSGYQGLFGYNNGTIQNVILEEGYVKSTGANVGLLVGQNGGKIKNITTTGMVNGTENVGGIVGHNFSESENSIELCVNNAIVTYNKVNATFGIRIGGIVGWNDSKIEKCINRGTVTGAHSTGGIVGVNSDQINECINYGKILGAEPFMDTISVGGMVGANAWTTFGKIRNCINLGEISSSISSDIVYIGGMIGQTLGGTNGHSLIENCYSVGKIYNSQNSGGILGIVHVRTNDVNEMRNNYWLQGCGVTYGIGNLSSNVNAERKTTNELKGLAEVLGEAFEDANGNEINGGYPILKWQKEEL